MIRELPQDLKKRNEDLIYEVKISRQISHFPVQPSDGTGKRIDRVRSVRQRRDVLRLDDWE